MELRGRWRKSPDLENKILKTLRESKNAMGFRELFSKLDPGSKSTLIATLKLLISQNKIEKNSAGKYKTTITLKLFSDIEGLRKLLLKMDNMIPKLDTEQHAYIGIKLWTIIFQNEFHPIKMFMQDTPYFRISNNVSKPIREKAVKEFFESYKYPSMFEDDMYNLFFDFCSKFSSSVLDSVFNKKINLGQKKPKKTDKNVMSLAHLFNKEVFVTHDLETIFYGTEFFKILLETRPDVCNNRTLQLLKKANMFQEIKIVE